MINAFGKMLFQELEHMTHMTPEGWQATQLLCPMGPASGGDGSWAIVSQGGNVHEKDKKNCWLTDKVVLGKLSLDCNY